jgi:DNA-directed RNA polymerase subunit RPC12/RpoP
MDSSKEAKVRIQIRCPQCGGDIDFLEEAQVIRCEYCGSQLLVVGREGVLRYVLPAKIQNLRELHDLAIAHLTRSGRISPRIGESFQFYAPFWRLQGTVYRWVFGSQATKVEFLVNEEEGQRPGGEIFTGGVLKENKKILLTRVLDHTIPGFSNVQIGLSSLGVRSQALRLQVFGKEHLEKRESFLPLDVSLDKAQSEAERFGNIFFETGNLSPQVLLHRFINKTFSVIYFPLWYMVCHHKGGQENLLIDGVAKTVLGSIPDVDDILNKVKGEDSRKSFQFSEIGFLPYRCPNCGWAFPFQPFSVIHFCATCRRLWQEKRSQLVEIEYHPVLPPQMPSMNDLLWVPFWRFQAIIRSVEGELGNMADFYRFAPPLRVVNEEKEARRPIYFYIPAIKFRNPPVSQTLASRLTFMQPELAFGEFPDGSHPCTAGGSLHLSDASELGPIIFGGLIPPSGRKAKTWLKECNVDLQAPQIFYFPFSQVDLFWKELSTGIAFQRNALPGEFSQGNKNSES